MDTQFNFINYKNNTNIYNKDGLPKYNEMTREVNSSLTRGRPYKQPNNFIGYKAFKPPTPDYNMYNPQPIYGIWNAEKLMPILHSEQIPVQFH